MTDTMTDIERARQALPGHSMVLCRGEQLLISDKRGIAPMLDFFDAGVDMAGYAVADIIVGKAAALLFVRAGIVAVFAQTLSRSGKAILDEQGIPVTCEILTERIQNRTGTGMCPMEQAVADTDDPEFAYVLIKKRLSELRESNTKTHK